MLDWLNDRQHKPVDTIKPQLPPAFRVRMPRHLVHYNQRSRRRIDLCRHIICPSAAHAASGVTLRRHLTRCDLFPPLCSPPLYHHLLALANTILRHENIFPILRPFLPRMPTRFPIKFSPGSFNPFPMRFVMYNGQDCRRWFSPLRATHLLLPQ